MPVSTVPASSFGRLLRAMLGPAALSPMPEDVSRWLDDGGPSTAEDYGYEHTITAAP